MAQARIRRIKKIGDYRTFKKWSDEDRANEFRRINLVYGTNGSGKSTLASLLRDAAASTIFNVAPQLELEVEISGSRSMVTETDSTFWPRVRVFNADYVRENLRFDDASGPSPDSLLTLGKPNVEAQKQLEEAQRKIADLSPKLQPARIAAVAADAQLQRRLSAVASDVVDDLRRSSVAKYRATNSYSKANVRTLLEGQQDVFDGISTDIVSDRTTATAQAMPVVTLIAQGEMAGAATVEKAREILGRDVSVIAIEKLRGNQDRSKWVQDGISLHENLPECLFCGQPLTEHRRKELASHFSNTFTDLQRDIDELIALLNSTVSNSKTFQDEIPRDGDLYPDLEVELRKARSEYRIAHDIYAKCVLQIVAELSSKRNNPFGVHILDEMIALQIPSTSNVESLIAKHKIRSESHSNESTSAARRVELARVSEFRDEYSALKKDAADKQELVEKIEAELRTLDNMAIGLQNVSANPVPKADELTKNVERLLGRSEFKFTSSIDGKHYLIERGSSPATHLSEGERTTIALLHFLASVQEDVVAGDEPIVVIDDPVSSMDDSILFGASSYLWTELVRKTFASQVFLLTHNFELFRQWLVQLELAKTRVADGFTIHELRMRYVPGASGTMNRAPQFDPWTDDLKRSQRLRSLYHFLFARVAGAIIESTPELSLAERMDLLALAPNAARKMLESFLSFKFPDQIGNFHGSMESALAVVKDAAIRNRVERYLHSYSHNEQGDISAVLDPSEATVVLRALFEMIRVIDEQHFSAMCRALSIDETQLLQLPTSSVAEPST